MDSQQRPEGLFSQLEALASRSTGASAAQEAAFLTKLETIQLQRNVVEVHKAEKDVKPSFDVRSVLEFDIFSDVHSIISLFSALTSLPKVLEFQLVSLYLSYLTQL